MDPKVLLVHGDVVLPSARPRWIASCVILCGLFLNKMRTLAWTCSVNKGVTLERSHKQKAKPRHTCEWYGEHLRLEAIVARLFLDLMIE